MGGPFGLALGLAMALSYNGQAQLIFQDSFNYPDGPLLTAPGSPWVNNYPPTNEVKVSAGELFLTQSEQESVRVDFSKTYANTNLYAAFTVRFTALPAGAGNYFAFFRAGGTDALFCRVWAATNGAAGGKYRLGIRAMTASAVMIPNDLSLGVAYTVVAKLAISNSLATATLWINPSSESSNAMRAEDQQPGFGYQAGHFGFKQVAFYESAQDGMGNLLVDNLRIGLSFATVLPFRFTAIQPDGKGGINLHGVGAAGATYTVLANTNLAPGDWTGLGPATADANGLLTYSDATATNHARRYYRLLAQ